MTDLNLIPDLVRQVKDLQRRLYELERRQFPTIPPAATGQGIPFHYDDGTFTYDIKAESGSILLETQRDSTGGNDDQKVFINDGSVQAIGTGDFRVTSGGSAAGGDMFLDAENGRMYLECDTAILMQSGNAAGAFTSGSPTLTLRANNNSNVVINATAHDVYIGDANANNVIMLQYASGADPAAPPDYGSGTRYGRLYMRDNGSGKMQVVARFPTGAIQVIATEP
jgi:hypothetical protein